VIIGVPILVVQLVLTWISFRLSRDSRGSQRVAIRWCALLAPGFTLMAVLLGLMFGIFL
jgi:hypothetical protein